MHPTVQIERLLFSARAKETLRPLGAPGVRVFSTVLLMSLAAVPWGSGCKIVPAETTIPEPPDGCDRSDPYNLTALVPDVDWLSAPELDGRSPGSVGDELASDFLAARFECLGLTPFEGSLDFKQLFTTSEGVSTTNVVGMLQVETGALADEVIVVSAHYDHLGGGYLGANDNASGVSALLAIADDFVHRMELPARTVVFAAFGAEELGFEGSEAFMSSPPAGFSPDAVVYNINLDMVGTYNLTETLYVLGSFANTPGRAAVEALAEEHPGLELELGDESSESDHASFCTRGIPYLFFWTEDEECYHETCDTADRIDFVSLGDLALLVADTTWELASSSKISLQDIDSTEDVCAGP